jgi:hypothetical protein
MSIIVTKSYLYQILFALCVSIPILNIYELTFAVWAIAIIITLKLKYSYTIIRLITVFIIIIIVSFFSSSFEKFRAFYFIKDITYLIKPAMGILLGYQLFRNKFPTKVFQTIIHTGIAIASIHMVLVFFTFLSGNATSVARLREYCGYFNDFEVYALIILIFNNKFEVSFSKSKLYIFVFILAISSFFYLARINFIQFVILFVALKGYLRINAKSIIVLGSVLVFITLGYVIIYNLNPRRNGSGVEQFLYKIKNAPIEAFKTNIDINNWKDLNDNYRSFENVLTIKQVFHKGPRAVVSGEGLGSSVDLKKKIWLQSSYMRYIPFLHNSFMTVFLKSGLIGVFLLLYSIFLLFENPKSQIPIVQNINLLLVGTGLFLIFSSWVFLGLFNLSDNKAILIGFLICYRQYKIKTLEND